MTERRADHGFRLTVRRICIEASKCEIGFVFKFPRWNGSSAADNAAPVPYTTDHGEHYMALLNRVFATRTLLQIIFVLTTIMMKAISAHYDFSWATALAAG